MLLSALLGCAGLVEAQTPVHPQADAADIPAILQAPAGELSDAHMRPVGRSTHVARAPMVSRNGH